MRARRLFRRALCGDGINRLRLKRLAVALLFTGELLTRKVGWSWCATDGWSACLPLWASAGSLEELDSELLSEFVRNV